MAADFFFNSVSSLLHFDGADASTTFTDVTGTVWTRNVATISTVQSKFGGASGLFNGSSAYLTTPVLTKHLFGSGDFTVEAQVYQAAQGTAQKIVGIWSDTSGAGFSWKLEVTATNKLQLTYSTTGGDNLLVTATSVTVPLTTMTHVAAVRSGTNIYLFQDGVLVGSATGITATFFAAPGTKLVEIGRDGAGPGGYFNGYIDELRITKGVARYTAAFTPPTEAFADVVTAGEIDLDVALPALAVSLAGGSFIAATLPMPAVTIFTGPSLDVSLPALEFTGSMGGSLSATLPMVQVLLLAHDSAGENALDVSLPSLAFEAFGGASMSGTLPALEFDGALTVTNWGMIDATLPALDGALSGTTSAVVTIAATLPMLDFVGYGGAVLSVTLGAVTTQITATSGGVASISMTLPMFDVVISATAQAHGEIDAIIPALESGPYLQMWATLPMVQFVAVGTATVTATYEAYSLNLKHAPGHEGPDELTRYSNFPFDQIIRYRGSYFGVAAGGLYLLEGTTDFAPATPLVPTAIPWDWRTCMTDFGSPNKHTAVSAYFGGRLGPAATITLWAGDTADQAYSFETPRGSEAQTYRQKFGRGVKSRYSSLGAAGEGELALDTIELNIATLARRI